MAFYLNRVARALLPPAMDEHRPPADQQHPECIMLAPRADLPPSPLPPVRIFLGTERGQFRAEQVFVWSVMKHRDPSRRYEIHLLRELKGFRRGYWLTGFTNYRFAVPEFCGFEGRAIYNDTDQIYLTDPAELFDLDMADAGFLSINDRDTSVMLIDCGRMAGVWSAEHVRRDSRKALESAARRDRLWGRLSPEWNARDSEYRAGASKLVHFTTLQTQPWRPFPDQFVYLDNPTGALWPDLEAECRNAGFLMFTADAPSRRWAGVRDRLARHPQGSRLLLGPTPPARDPRPVTVEGLLEQVPDNDLPWVLDRLFATSTILRLRVREPRVARGGRERRSAWFWQQQLELAAAGHPEVRWDFHRRCGRSRQWLVGGPKASGPIVVLNHTKPGHNHNALALARALAERTGRPLVQVTIPWTAARFVGERLLGRARLPSVPSDAAALVAAGWLPATMARHLARGMGRDLRLVLLGRKAGAPPASGGVLVQCHHFDLPSHPRRIRALLPMNAGCTAAPPADTSTWQDWRDAPRRVALLVGGDTRAHRLADPEGMARAVSAWAREQDARLLVVTSRRSAAALDGLRGGLAEQDLLHVWQAHDPGNPYGLALSEAQQLVVTGESESMLADAVNSAAPLQIWPLQPIRGKAWDWLVGRIAHHAATHRYNARGSIRPQQGRSYLCARLLERGWVLPPRNLERMHAALVSQGLASYFGTPPPQPGVGFAELQPVVDRIVSSLALEAHELSKPGAHLLSTPFLPAFEPTEPSIARFGQIADGAHELTENGSSADANGQGVAK